MRITSQMRRGQMLYDLERLQSELYRAQQVLNTGREVEKPSDDPVRAQKALVARSNLARRSQYIDNIRDGMTHLSYAEAAVSAVNGLLSDGRAMAVQAANDGLTAQDKASMAEEIDVLLEDLFNQANTKEDGGFLFGGFNTQESPYTATRDLDTGRITQVQGQPTLMDGKIEATVAEQLRVRINVNGTELFQTGTPGDSGDMFQLLIDMRDTLLAAGDGDDIGADLEDIIGRFDDALNRSGDLLTSVGGRYDRLYKMEQRQLDMEVREQEQLSDAEDGDLAEWASRFQMKQIALQQAMAVGTQVLNSSLVNFIR